MGLVSFRKITNQDARFSWSFEKRTGCSTAVSCRLALNFSMSLASAADISDRPRNPIIKEKCRVTTERNVNKERLPKLHSYPLARLTKRSIVRIIPGIR